MENKINVAELLKYCPSGMELDCTIFDDVKFSHIDSGIYPIVILTDGIEESLTKYGHWDTRSTSKCVIFPKGKTTWEGFVPSCKFKDGDIVCTNGDNIAILGDRVGECSESFYSYCGLFNHGFDVNVVVLPKRFASEEEKQKLFQAIKDNGYKLNAETKTLEELIEPEFKIEKGKWYVCTKDLFDNYENKAFHKGDIYLSTQDESLIPSNSNIPYKVKYCADEYFQKWTISDAKDGDILYSTSHHLIWIYKDDKHYYACMNMNYVTKNVSIDGLISIPNDACPATKVEQSILFARVKEEGYEWIAKTKTLNKLPKFKVGDVIKSAFNNNKYEIKYITDTHYTLVEIENKFKYIEPIIEDKNWKLAPNKFDINTLKPFESRVLVRDYINQVWIPTFWGKRLEDDSNCSYLTTNGCYKYCIPYDKNEHLLGTTTDCDEFYKTWEQ